MERTPNRLLRVELMSRGRELGIDFPPSVSTVRLRELIIAETTRREQESAAADTERNKMADPSQAVGDAQAAAASTGTIPKHRPEAVVQPPAGDLLPSPASIADTAVSTAGINLFAASPPASDSVAVSSAIPVNLLPIASQAPLPLPLSLPPIVSSVPIFSTRATTVSPLNPSASIFTMASPSHGGPRVSPAASSRAHFDWNSDIEAHNNVELPIAARNLAVSPATVNRDAVLPTTAADDDAELDRVLSQLRKRKEILELKRQIAVLEDPNAAVAAAAPVAHTRSGSRRLGIHEIRSIITPFTGDSDEACDVRKFLDNVDRLLNTMDCDEQYRYMALRSVLADTAADVMDHSITLTYEDLRQELIREFGRAWSATELLDRLRNRRWDRQGETLHRFVIRMQGLARRGNVNEIELVDIVVDNMGLSRDDTNMLLTSATTMTALKDAIVRHEKRIMANIRDQQQRRANLAANSRRYPSANVPAARSGAAQSRPLPRQPAPPANSDKPRCFNCRRQDGHSRKDCPHPHRPEGSCFRCWQPGHRHTECTNTPYFSPARQVAALPDMEFDFGDDEEEGAAGGSKTKPVNHHDQVSIAFLLSPLKQTEYSKLTALFDTGSPISFVRRDAIPCALMSTVCKLPLRGVGGSSIAVLGRIQAYIKYRGTTKIFDLAVLPNEALSVPVILGRDYLNLMKIYLHFVSHRNEPIKERELKQNRLFQSLINGLPLVIAQKPNSFSQIAMTERNGKSCVSTESIESKKIAASVSVEHLCPVLGYQELTIAVAESSTTTISVDVNPNLPANDRKLIEKIVENEYLNASHIVVTPHPYAMNITLTDNTPFHAYPRRLSYHERAEVQKTLDALLERKIIRPSNSPYASAVVLVKKKSGETRMCVDFRTLNKVTARDNFPIPLIEDCISYLGGKRYFTTMDLKDGFFHVTMAPDSVKYTSFVVPQGQYEYLKMPFGLKNAPAVFQRFVSEILHDLIAAEKIRVYIDDIIIATADLAEHANLLTTVLNRLASKGLELKLSKCKFAYQQIDYLGYTVTDEGIRPNGDHVTAIRELAYPTDAKELQRIIGLFSYFRMFVRNFSQIARPLRQLLTSGEKFELNENCRQAFDSLKRRLTEGPVLCIYNSTRETELHVDASAVGYGAALMQRQPDGKFHPTSYFSQATTAAESRYHSFELETLGIVYGLRRYRVELQGIKFVVVTDCNSLKLTLEKRHLNPRIARWAMEFRAYDFELRHRPGTSMNHVDALSRCHPPHTDYAVESDLMNQLCHVDAQILDELPCRMIHALDEEEIGFHIAVTQSRDPIITALRDRLETGPVPKFKLQEGLVFHVPENGQPQLYIPTEMVDNVIRSVHEKIGHLAVDKTVDKLKRHYWFPKMRPHTESHIKNCIKCIMYASPVRASERNLYSIPKVPAPFHTLHIDHFGPLPSINSKRKHLLVVVDAFTKLTKLYPVNSTSTKEVIACLERYFNYYTRPHRIIADQASCFNALEFAEKMKDWNIDHVKIAVGSPQANGQVERVNRVIKTMMGKLVEPINHADWVQRLAQIEYALNNTKHRSTGCTASNLLFGIDQRGPIADELAEYIEKVFHEPRQANLEEIRESASKSIEKSQQYNEAYFARHSTPAKTYEVGDFVVMRNVDVTAGTNKKLIPKYRGPFVVYKTLPHDRYAIRDIENCQLTQRPYDNILEAARLRKWIEPKNGCDGKIEECDTDNLIGSIMWSELAEL